MLSKKEFSKKVGEKIKVMRTKKNISQEELADKAGLYRTYIGHLENGRYSPSAYILYKIAQALDVSAKEFLPI